MTETNHCKAKKRYKENKLIWRGFRICQSCTKKFARARFLTREISSSFGNWVFKTLSSSFKIFANEPVSLPVSSHIDLSQKRMHKGTPQYYDKNLSNY